MFDKLPNQAIVSLLIKCNQHFHASWDSSKDVSSRGAILALLTSLIITLDWHMFICRSHFNLHTLCKQNTLSKLTVSSITSQYHIIMWMVVALLITCFSLTLRIEVRLFHFVGSMLIFRMASLKKNSWHDGDGTQKNLCMPKPDGPQPSTYHSGLMSFAV